MGASCILASHATCIMISGVHATTDANAGINHRYYLHFILLHHTNDLMVLSDVVLLLVLQDTVFGVP